MSSVRPRRTRAARCGCWPAPAPARRRRHGGVAGLVASGGARGADPAADLHAPGGAADARPDREPARRGPRSGGVGARWPAPERCAGGPSTLSRTGTARSCGTAGLPRASGWSTPPTLLTWSTSCASDLGLGVDGEPAVPVQGTLLDVYSRAVTLCSRCGGARGVGAVGGRLRRRGGGGVPGLRRPQSAPSACSTPTTCCCTGVRRCSRSEPALRCATASTTCSSTRPGRQRAAGRRAARPARAGRSLTVVGDDAQAVYGFRGADARHLRLP